MSTIGKTTYADMKQMETLLMKSELDWTVVRASGLFETEAVTDYVATFPGPEKYPYVSAGQNLRVSHTISPYFLRCFSARSLLH